MIDKLSPSPQKYDGLIGLVSMLMAGVMMMLVWPHLDGRLMYDEFAVGPSTLGDVAKGKDAKAVFGFIILASLLFIILRKYIKCPQGNQRAWPVNVQIAGILLLPLFPWLGMYIANGEFVWPEAWLAWLLIAGGLGLVWLLRKKTKTVPVDFEQLVLAQAGGLIFAFFSGLGLLAAATHVWPAIMFDYPLVCRSLAFAPFLLFFAMIAAIIFCSPDEHLRYRVHRWLLFSQFLLPLLSMAVLPDRIWYRGGWLSTVPAYPLLIAIAFFAVLSWRSLLRRRTNLEFRSGVSPWSIAAIAIFVSAGMPDFPRISGDHFHFGEQVVPWMQWTIHGKVPFKDLFPFHGWMHLFAGAVDSIFYDGRLSGFKDAQRLIFASSAAVTSMLVMRLAGARAGLFAALFFLPMTFYAGRLVLVAPVFLFLLLPPLRNRPWLWMGAWGAGVCLLGFYNTVSGAAFALGSSPFALWMLWVAWRDFRKQLVYLAGACAVIAAVILLVLPSGILSGYLSFIQENRPAYGIVQGRAWAESFGSTPFSKGLLALSPVYELLRSGWILLLLLALYAAIYRTMRLPGSDRFAGLFMTLGMALVLIFMSSYTLGRIDAGSAGRQGTLTYLLAAAWLPVVMITVLQIGKTASLSISLFLAGALTAVMDSGSRWDIRNAYWQAMRGIRVPDEMIRFSSDDRSKRFLEGTFLSPEESAGIANFNKALDEIIDEGQTYADLSSRQAFYIYSGKPVPVTHAAVANIDNQIKQSFVIKQLAANPPPAVLIHPRFMYDLDVNIRSYSLWRYVMLNYEPVSAGDLVFMVNQDSPAFTRRMAGADKIKFLKNNFWLRDLELLPVAWGRSWEQLSRLARPVSALRLSPSGDGIIRLESEDHATPPVIMNGRGSDLLVLEVERGPDGRADELILQWNTEWGLSDPCRFRGRASTLVLPVGMFPDWLLAEKIERLQLQVPSGLKIISASLWLRNDPAGS